jgi:hypothetical protein
MDKNKQIIMEQFELLADDSADILLKLERRGVLSPEQNDIVTSELDLLFKKRIEKILAS